MVVSIDNVKSRHSKEADVNHHDWKASIRFIESEGFTQKEVEEAIENAIASLGDSDE